MTYWREKKPLSIQMYGRLARVNSIDRSIIWRLYMHTIPPRSVPGEIPLPLCPKKVTTHWRLKTSLLYLKIYMARPGSSETWMFTVSNSVQECPNSVTPVHASHCWWHASCVPVTEQNVWPWVTNSGGLWCRRWSRLVPFSHFPYSYTLPLSENFQVASYTTFCLFMIINVIIEVEEFSDVGSRKDYMRLLCIWSAILLGAVITCAASPSFQQRRKKSENTPTHYPPT